MRWAWHTTQEIQEKQGAWTALADACPWTTPFQRPEWLLPWCRHLGPRDPWWLGVWSGDDLLGLAPLFAHSPNGRRVVTQLGVGITDRLDVLVAPGWEAVFLDAMERALAERSGQWDLCHFQELMPGSLLLAVGKGQGWPRRQERQSACPVLLLERAQPHAGIPETQMNKLKRAEHRARKLGTVRVVSQDGPDSALHLFDELLRLHRARWQRRGQQGVLGSNQVQAFHRDVIRGASLRGNLFLHGLEVGGQMVSVVYGFRERRAAYFYLGGFDPAVAKISPTLVLIGRTLGGWVEQGVETVDFLRGQEAYKYDWGARDVYTVCASVEQSAAAEASAW